MSLYEHYDVNAIRNRFLIRGIVVNEKLCEHISKNIGFFLIHAQ